MNEDELYVELSYKQYMMLSYRPEYYVVISQHTKVYYKNNVFHRLNGPAYIQNSDMYYYINNKHFTKEEFDQHPDVIQYRIRKFQEYLQIYH